MVDYQYYLCYKISFCRPPTWMNHQKFTELKQATFQELRKEFYFARLYDDTFDSSIKIYWFKTIVSPLWLGYWPISKISVGLGVIIERVGMIFSHWYNHSPRLATTRIWLTKPLNMIWLKVIGTLLFLPCSHFSCFLNEMKN